MKIIFGFLMALLIVPLVKADLTVNENFYSGGGNVFYSADINSDGGEVEVIIDGVNINDQLTTLSESVDTELTTLSQSVNTELNTLYNSVDGSFDAYALANYIGRVTDVINGQTEGSDLEQQMAYDLSNTFLTQKHLDYINYNSFRLDIIETFLVRNFQKEYCDVVKEFVKKNGFKMARCGNSTIIRTSYGTLTVEDFPQNNNQLNNAEEEKEEEQDSEFEEQKNNEFKSRVVNQYEGYLSMFEGTNNAYYQRLAQNLKKAYPNFFV